MKSINQWTKKELLELPVRAWDTPTNYDSLLIFSTGKKHNSGYAMIAIIGVKKGKPVEIAAQCSDDIEWKLPSMIYVGQYSIGQMRMDYAIKSGAMHAWCDKYRFYVGHALSSITIELKT
jgi:hypothetical protein